MRLLILGASDYQLPAIVKAKEMGLTVGIADMNPNAVGVRYADYYYHVSTIDEEGVLAAAKDFKADGILTLCTDMPMRALAYACESLNLCGLDYRSSITATDKYEMIKAFEKADVPHPWFIMARKNADLNILKTKVCYPAITKPIDNSGSRGIMLVQNQDELASAVNYSSIHGRNGDVLVEEYMQGPEVSVEIIVVNGEAHVIQITDKYTSGSPHYVEIGHSQPSRLSREQQDEICEIAKKAALAVGIKDGAAHAEVILTDNGPKMVEIGARLGGGCITTHLTPLSTGVDMTKAVIDIALGKKPDLARKTSKGSAIRFLLPKPGIVKSIDGLEAAKDLNGVIEVKVDCMLGDRLGELESGASRIGHIIAQADTAQKAMGICDEAYRLIRIEIE